jgi:hypothetical protein
MHTINQRSLAAPLALAALLGGCAMGGVGSSSQPASVEAPQYRVGDRWVYRITEGYRVKAIYDETHTVTGIGADGITVEVVMKGPRLDAVRTERWPSPGRVTQGSLFDVETRRFREPLERYRFPLVTGSTWNERPHNFNEYLKREGQISHYVRVGGLEKVTTPAGTFDAVRLSVMMRLDDEEFWRYPTECNYVVWYAPAVKAAVREMRRAEYQERSYPYPRLEAQSAVIELVSFTPGA